MMRLFKPIILSSIVLSMNFASVFLVYDTPMTICVKPKYSMLPVKSKDILDINQMVIRDTLKIVNEMERKEELFSGKTLYDMYSDEELELLFRVVEAEATEGDVACKSHVASVIFNRVGSGWHNGDLIKNLMAKRQFEVITNGRYKRVKITDETIKACEIGFRYDTTKGAMYFDCTNGESYAAKNKEFIFRDAIKHDFYK